MQQQPDDKQFTTTAFRLSRAFSGPSADFFTKPTINIVRRQTDWDGKKKTAPRWGDPMLLPPDAGSVSLTDSLRGFLLWKDMYDVVFDPVGQRLFGLAQ